MSRSIRKTPVFGHTSARSEADCKCLWHKRWRAAERDRLATVDPDADHVTTHRNAVSSTWDMAKNGKAWFAQVANLRCLSALLLDALDCFRRGRRCRRDCLPSGAQSSLRFDMISNSMHN